MYQCLPAIAYFVPCHAHLDLLFVSERNCPSKVELPNSVRNAKWTPTFASLPMLNLARMKIEIPKGFSLWTHGKYSIVLRDDLHRSCCDLVIDLAKKPAAGRGKVFIAPFPSSEGHTILAAFRRTVRGGPYSRFGFESTVGFIPRTLSELTVAVAAEKAGASVVTPLGCYWNWGTGGIGYTSGYFSVYQEKALCLSEVLEAWRLTNPRLIQRRQVLSQLAQALKHLHQVGIIHTDLTLKNVLFQPGGGCSFIDLDGAFAVRRISDRSRISALSRLNRSLEKSNMGELVPLQDRLWFLKEYLGALQHNKALVRHILVRAALDVRLHRLFWRRKSRVP